MGGLSLWQLLIVAAVVILLFGRGKISEMMGDVAKGVKSFKKGLADDDEPQKIEEKPAMTVDAQASTEKTKTT